VTVAEQRSSRGGDQASRGKGRRGSSRKPRTRRGRSSGRKRGGRSEKPPKQTELRIRHIGTVKWFDEDRGFGFIAQEDGEELFVHSTGVLVKAAHGLEQGQQVEYEIEHTKRGLQAVDVVPLS
jgi:CspA family cold shock protein